MCWGDAYCYQSVPFFHSAGSACNLMTLPLGALLSAFLVTPAVAVQEQDSGYVRTYVIHADAAWVAPGEVVSPAYVQISEGKIDWVSTEDRRVARRTPFGEGEKPPLLEVSGTLAPGVIDAWTTFSPGDFANDRNAGATRRMRESLPGLFPGEDRGLASQVLAARQAGVSAVYLSTGTGALRTGIGTAASFAAVDLPLATGVEALDCSVGTTAGGNLSVGNQAKALSDAFREARDWRESLDEYADKVEKYDEDLVDYQKKLDEFIAKEDKTDKDKAPKRPKRPKKPAADPARDLLLDAMDGKLQVRVRAETVADIRSMLKMAEDFDLELVLVGGLEADLIADELVDARVPLVMPAVADRHADGDNGRSFTARFQRLDRAGVRIALASGGSSAEQARLLSHAGRLISAGVELDTVWTALTITPAEILGLKDAGRLARGQSATMILFEGKSPFDASASFKTHKPK